MMHASSTGGKIKPGITHTIIIPELYYCAMGAVCTCGFVVWVCRYFVILWRLSGVASFKCRVVLTCNNNNNNNNSDNDDNDNNNIEFNNVVTIIRFSTF